jgi:hypothetical protein
VLSGNCLILKTENLESMKKLLVFLVVSSTIFPGMLPAQEAIPDSLVQERIRCIETMLEQDRKGTDAWWYGWLAGYSALTVGQGAVGLASEDKATRQDMALGAATTLLGAAGQFISPLHPGKKGRMLAELPESTPEERLKKLTIAEEYLENVAKTEKFGRSWQNHALYGAVSIGSGLVTWLGFKRTIWAGLGNFALNTVVSEIQIWTQPTRSLKNYREYRRKYQSDVTGIAPKPGPEFYFGVLPDGIGLRISFPAKFHHSFPAF